MANTDKRGFASMDDDKQRDIASKGGSSVPAEKRSFSQDPELASEAGKKGGESSQGGQQQASGSDRGQKGSESSQGRQQQASDSDRGQQSGGSERGGSGNFAKDREKASEAGKKGGKS